MNLSRKYKPKIKVEINRTKYLLISLFSIFICSQALAQYEIRKHSINSGGVAKSSESFELRSSIAQVDANPIVTDDDISVSSGYWQQNNDLIFRNNFK